MESKAGSRGVQRFGSPPSAVRFLMTDKHRTVHCALYRLDTIQTIGSQSDSASNVCKIPPLFSARIPGTVWRLQVSYQAIIDGQKKIPSIKLTPDSAKVIGQLLLPAFYETSHV